jgi:hypothetical protein
MDGTLFLAIMIAVGWLVIWCCVDRSKARNVWWPFDYVFKDEPSEKLPQQPETGDRGDPLPSWRSVERKVRQQIRAK